MSFIFCQVIKVRGYKIVVRHLPHETHHVEAVLKILETQDEHKNWETNYFLLLWMSILVLIPFHLARYAQPDTFGFLSVKNPVKKHPLVCNHTT